MSDLVVGVNGGNSKTDLILADTGGRLLAWVRGAGTRPHTDGMAITTERLVDLLHRALLGAGLPTGTPVAVGAYFLANVDVPAEEDKALRHLTALGVAEQVIVHNDTLAILRAGAPVALAVSGGEIPVAELHGLAPLVFAAADGGDAVAREIVVRLGEEIITLVVALLRRLDLVHAPAPVVLGGGTLQNGHVLLEEHIRARLAAEAPLALVRVLDVQPVAGAVAEALTAAGASPAAQHRARDAIAGRQPPPPHMSRSRSSCDQSHRLGQVLISLGWSCGSEDQRLVMTSWPPGYSRRSPYAASVPPAT
jgi:N-acetylglucosamine kinase-like BadF-type ATPase